MEIKLKNSNIHINIWEPEDETRGVVQVIHGMGEHSGRYKEFAEYLNKEGYLVVATDHRGHGKSVKDIDGLGRIEEGFEVLVKDEIELTKILTEIYPKLPIYILGHSMGSFIAQGHLKEAENFRGGYILSGSCKTPYLKTNLGSKFGKTLKMLGKNKKSNIMNKLLFAGYNKAIKENLTVFDWLSRDTREVKKYILDTQCGFIYSAGFYASFLDYLSKLFDEKDFKYLDKDIPIYIFSGDKDPVGFYGSGVKKLYNFYERLGYKNLKIKLYIEGRHEMMNETNRLEVLKDILDHLKSLEKL